MGVLIVLGIVFLYAVFVVVSLLAPQISLFIGKWRNKRAAQFNAKSHAFWSGNVEPITCKICGIHWDKRAEISCAVYRHTNIDHKTIGTD